MVFERIGNWIKGREYVLINRDNQDMEAGTFPVRVTAAQVRAMIKDGDIEPGTYRLIERTKAGDRTVWSMARKRELSPEEILQLDKDKAFKILREKKKSVAQDVKELNQLTAEINKEFSVDGISPPIELPDEKMGLFDSINRALSDSAYIGIRKHPEKTTEMIFGIGDAIQNILVAAGNYAAMKVTEKAQANIAKKQVKKQIEKVDGKKVIKFKLNKESEIDEEETTETERKEKEKFDIKESEENIPEEDEEMEDIENDE